MSEDQANQLIAKGKSIFESDWLLPVRFILICMEGPRPMALLCLMKDLPDQREFGEASQEACKHAKAYTLFICTRTAFSLKNCMITSTNKQINK